MFRTWMVFLFIASLAIAPGIAAGDIFTFDMEGIHGATIDGATTHTFTDTAGGNSFDVILAATGGDFNQTGSGFGINASGAGDDSDALDNGLTNESIRFTFETSAALGIKLVSLDFDRMTGGGGTGDDQALVSFYDAGDVFNNSLIVHNGNTAGDDQANFDGGSGAGSFATQISQSGSYFDLSVSDGNGIGLEGFTIDVDAVYYSGGGGGGGGAVPEPTAAILMAIGAFALLGYRRRR